MLIFKDTKAFLGGAMSVEGLTRDGVAVTAEEVYIVAEDSDLARKVSALFPDFAFVVDDGGNLIDVTATPHVASEEEKRAKYEELAVEKIRGRYSQNDENKILREALASGTFDDFDLYNSYVEQCKKSAYTEIYGEVKL